MTVGRRIKAARKAAGMTQKELGKKLGISESAVAQYETGNRNPKIKRLAAIANALGISWLDLAGEEKELELTVGKNAAKQILHESMEFAAEDMAKEQATMREITEKAKKFQERLDAKGLKYTDLLELEALAHRLGDMGHNILLGYERGEGWPSGT